MLINNSISYHLRIICEFLSNYATSNVIIFFVFTSHFDENMPSCSSRCRHKGEEVISQNGCVSCGKVIHPSCGAIDIFGLTCFSCNDENASDDSSSSFEEVVVVNRKTSATPTSHKSMSTLGLGSTSAQAFMPKPVHARERVATKKAPSVKHPKPKPKPKLTERQLQVRRTHQAELLTKHAKLSQVKYYTAGETNSIGLDAVQEEKIVHASSTSMLWNYFRKFQDKSLQTYVACNICFNIAKYPRDDDHPAELKVDFSVLYGESKSTSKLSDHLNTFHKDIYNEYLLMKTNAVGSSSSIIPFAN